MTNPWQKMIKVKTRERIQWFKTPVAQGALALIVVLITFNFLSQKEVKAIANNKDSFKARDAVLEQNLAHLDSIAKEPEAKPIAREEVKTEVKT